MKMKVVLTEGSMALEVPGHGTIERNEPVDMNAKLAFDLVSTRIVSTADEASALLYQTMRTEKLAAATGLFTCDQCGSQVPAEIVYPSGGCKRCS